ncbi:MAG: acyltransferase [Lachnospiraceae bacterium]|nr:acyltransferase [Lachnospiraceae bacterium]
MEAKMKLILGGMRLVLHLLCNLKRLRVHSYKYYIGKGVKFWLHKGGICDLGIKTWLSEYCNLEANGGKIILGYNNFFNTNCSIIAMERIEIGDNNLFGPNVVIVDHDHEYKDSKELICKQGMKKKPVKIGSNVWIGANVVITRGVTICDKVVVGANSVVTKDINKPGVYVGTPVKLVKNIE